MTDADDAADATPDAPTVLIAGTASHVGKSTLAAGLCRLLARRGVSVAPYKAQNMSNNARVALAPDGEWGEVGVSQHVQARAAETVPTTDMNPVLLKPRGGGESQIVIDGGAVANAPASAYYDDYWDEARDAAIAAHERLAAGHDVIVAEGAGSVAEINLHDRDLANVECARFADARILIAVDIERGGAFASLYGTLELLPDDLRERVCGAVITKFRGDPDLLEPGIDEIEDRTGVPIVGVVPHDDPGLPAEDSLSLPDEARAGGETGSAGGSESVLGGDDGVPDGEAVRVGVPRLPRISNFTDLEPLAREPGVRVVYLPLDAGLDGVDAVVLPGSKNTVDDLLALREPGLDAALRAFDGPVVGVCGGYQILGERLVDAAVEGTGDRETVPGVGLLPVETGFSTDKRVERVTCAVDGVGPIAGAAGEATGYEIRAGRTRLLDGKQGESRRVATEPLGAESAATDRVLGTYLHGLFETEAVRDAFVERVYESAGRTRPDAAAVDRSPYDRAADLVADHVDLRAAGLGDLLGSPDRADG
ncbi:MULTISPECIES: cobyric acid synthase [Halorubrum]|uniref:Probable cobyric acid synthase n=1 Tax=Halorubrum hochstenium ATCC 700873 TaxID=1227481 RepID=M0FGV8_9EURY|nr:MULTISPECIES: cobyric acid synthase [Halorubrum]ELZ59170.1 cobyric acid synthase [Halorubrum hochstenium ATCC 700873]